MTPAEPGPEAVFILAPIGRDAELAQRFLGQAGIGSFICKALDDFCPLEGKSPAAALIAEEALSEAAIVQLLTILEHQPPWSDLPIAVFRDPENMLAGPSRPLSRLLSKGNVTLLDRPVGRITLVSTVRAFLRARRRQYEVRDLVVQLEGAVKERDRFLAILGHELRNPLGAILASTEIMARTDTLAFRRERDVIDRQTQVLSRLVDDLLDVSRVTSGKIVLHTEPVNLRELAEKAVQSAADAAAPHGVHVSLVAEARPFVVSGDRVRLEQVLNNLLTNALKYTPKGGSVTVSLEEERGQAVLRVRDTGIGISPEMLPLIFDLFAQAEGSLDRAQGGMGIGLTLVKSLVALHGGEASGHSEGPGTGSTFTVSLPLGSASFPDASGSFERHSPRAPIARHVVVVEDNPDLREQLVELLEGSGHRVESSENGLAGVELIVHARPEIALVDIGLPGIDGYEVARRVRERIGHSVSLVALTGYGQPEDRRRALEAGFDAHLTKPVRIGLLEQMVAHGVRAPMTIFEASA
jgi:signal transduction histidine kinase/ActR/RegA family two-component response regulator